MLKIEYEKEDDKELMFKRSDFLNLLSSVRFEIIKRLIFPKFCDEKFFHQFNDFVKSSKSGKKLETKSVVFRVFGENLFIERRK